jgi:hypothetical protein
MFSRSQVLAIVYDNLGKLKRRTCRGATVQETGSATNADNPMAVARTGMLPDGVERGQPLDDTPKNLCGGQFSDAARRDCIAWAAKGRQYPRYEVRSPVRLKADTTEDTWDERYRSRTRRGVRLKPDTTDISRGVRLTTSAKAMVVRRSYIEGGSRTTDVSLRVER